MSLSSSSAHVLYVDHQGYPSPLGRCYYATASRRLSSSSLSSEIDSAYCPQCLSFWDHATAASMEYQCPKPGCAQCPICRVAIASVVIEDEQREGEATDDDEQQLFQRVCYYRCGYCSWNSKSAGLVITDKDVPAEGQQQLQQWKVRLTDEWKQRRQNMASDAQYKSTLQKLEIQAKQQVKQQQQPKSTAAILLLSRKKSQHPPTQTGRTAGGVSAGAATDGPWNMKALEESLQLKNMPTQESNSTGLGVKIEATTDFGTPMSSFTDPTPSPLSILIQPNSNPATSAASSSPSPSSSPLLPLPVVLRSRCTRRCRAELLEGRPGIVLKPKLNPLEGDTSLRSGHGQWWKKDSSAVHSVPKVTVAKVHQHPEENTTTLLFKITNPTLSVVKLRLRQSNYQGIPTAEAIAAASGNPTPATTATTDTTTRQLKNLLVNSLRGTRISTKLQQIDKASGKSSTFLSQTDWVRLEAVEDSLFGPSQVPKSILEWEPTPAAVGSNDACEDHYRVVASLGDTAWLELKAPPYVQFPPTQTVSFSLQLQIAVGKGSWESSLIQAQGTNDVVKFDLVVVVVPTTQDEQ